MDIYEIRKTNLVALIGKRRKGACADKWGMSAAHLSQILSDKTDKNLGDDVARRIEDREGLPRGWLDQLQTHWLSPPASMTHADDGIQTNVESGPPITSSPRRVDIVGTAQLGPDGYWEGITPGTDGWIETYSRDQEAYALRLKGDSMAPAIRSGWIAVCEPNHRLVPEEYVMVTLTSGQSMVKELLFDRQNELVLMSVNGNSRITISWDDIEHAHYVGAILPPSKVLGVV